MDFPTAVVSSTAIVTAGLTALKLVGIHTNGKKPINGNGITRKEISEEISKKMDKVVYEDTCKARQKALETEIKLTKDHLSEKVDMVQEVLQNGLNEIKKEIKNHRSGPGPIR